MDETLDELLERACEVLQVGASDLLLEYIGNQKCDDALADFLRDAIAESGMDGAR